MKKISVLFLFLLPILLAEGWVQAQSVGLRMPDTTSIQGTILEMPLYVDSTLTGKEVYSYSFQLSYNPNYLQPESVIITGTIGEPLGMPVLNTSVSGIVSFAAAGTAPLIGTGKLVIIRWILKNPGWMISLSFTDLKHNYLNEGTPPVTLKSGSISINQAPTITIYPDTKVIAKGDQLQMDVYGGTSPYTWYVTDGVLADIDQTGLLTAKASGMEKVVSMDAYGVRDTSQIIEIRPYKLSIPVNLTQWEGAIIDIPVLTTDLTGLNISSGNFQIGFNPNALSPEGIVQAGTLLETYQVFLKKAEGTVAVAFAGTTPLAGQGTLIYIRFRVLSYLYGTNIELDKALMNEKILAAYSNGYFSVKNFKYRSIYPSQGALVIGESVELNLNGEAIPPWKWSVSDSTIASINQAGILTGMKHGQVIVTVIDSAGAPAYTDNFTVFDTRILIPDTAICHYSQLLEYPLYLQTLPHDSIISFEGQLSYDTNKLSFSGIETIGTETQNWISSAYESDGKINFASSGSRALHTSGVLLKLKFLPKAVFVSGSWAGIHINEFALNEGSPYAMLERDGSISGIIGNTAFAEIHAASSSVICAGDTMYFKAFVQYGGIPHYQWLKNGNPIPGENADTLRISLLANNDNISCKVISTDPCVNDSIVYSNAVILTVNEKPVAPTGFSGEIVVTGGATNVTYSVPAIPNADSYIWHLSTGVTGASTTNSIMVNFTNTISSAVIKVSGVNGCGVGIADSLVVAVTHYSGLNSLTIGKVLLFPNPVNDQLHIVLNNTVDRNTKIEIYDATGQFLKIKNAQAGNEMTLDFSSQGSGIYLVKITQNRETSLFKIIKR